MFHVYLCMQQWVLFLSARRITDSLTLRSVIDTTANSLRYTQSRGRIAVLGRLRAVRSGRADLVAFAPADRDRIFVTVRP